MILKANDFHIRVVGKILCKHYTSLIVPDDGCGPSLNKSDIHQELSKPNGLLGAMICSHVLCLCCRRGESKLFLAILQINFIANKKKNTLWWIDDHLHLFPNIYSVLNQNFKKSFQGGVLTLKTKF